jgi:two-component system, cell cycle sensor histidine kinase and response regulator CckA
LSNLPQIASLPVNFERFTAGRLSFFPGIVKLYESPGRAGELLRRIYLPSSVKKVDEEDQGADHDLISGSGRILLVDDEPMIVVLASDLLKMLGYAVYQAANGTEAVSTYREKQDEIDLVILDMILPGMKGSQVLKTLREINPNIKVILSSGYGLQGEVRRVMETGCQAFIQKPYNFRDLSNIVHHVLHPSANTDTNDGNGKAGGNS